MSLRLQIVANLTAAMKASEQLQKDVLRMLKAEIMKEEVSGREKRELDDVEIVRIIKRMIKQRKDSINQFEKGGRTELAEKEKMEIPILEIYFPEQMSKEDIVAIITKKKEELGVTDKSKIGILIGAVMKEVRDRVDGGVVKSLVSEYLSL
jgi:uncharacterized protein